MGEKPSNKANWQSLLIPVSSKEVDSAMGSRMFLPVSLSSSEGLCGFMGMRQKGREVFLESSSLCSGVLALSYRSLFESLSTSWCGWGREVLLCFLCRINYAELQ